MSISEKQSQEDISIANKYLLPGLIESIKRDDYKSTKYLIEIGANPNGSEDMYGLIPLHYACEYKSIKSLNILLEKGANIYQRDANGVSPFDEAMSSKNNEIRDIFLNFDIEKKRYEIDEL